MFEYTEDNALFKITTPLGKNRLIFKSLQGEERISDLFYFNVEMVSPFDNLAFDDLVGQKVALEINSTTGHQRYFNGIVIRFVQGGTVCQVVFQFLKSNSHNCRK